MARKVRRNDPCPCGSGRKYKKCCLAQTQQEERRAYSEERAKQQRNEVPAHALNWLRRRYPEALRGAFEESEAEAVEDGRELSDNDADYFAMQTVEWVLAEGTARIDGQLVRLRDLVLEGSLLMEADQRLWFERSTQEPLRLWKVTRIEPGVGLGLRDLIDESADAVWVLEQSASRQLRKSEVIAARLGRWKDSWEIVILYSIPDNEILSLVQHLEEQAEGDLADPAVVRATGRRIRDYWVRLFTRRPVMPDVVDSQGDPILLVTDHWQILDERKLAERLANESDVVGSREEGWVRLEDPNSDLGRPLLALNPGTQPDRLESFTRTRALADEGRSWLEDVAGPALKFMTREIVDPLSERVLAGYESVAASPPAAEAFPIEVASLEAGSVFGTSPEAKSQFMESFYRKQYEGIEEDPIPALGNKSPREALKEPGGSRRVQLWMEGFERNEERMAAEDGREPVDLGFLWAQIGLERPTP